jgi:hypothetical protein
MKYNEYLQEMLYNQLKNYEIYKVRSITYFSNFR